MCLYLCVSVRADGGAVVPAVRADAGEGGARARPAAGAAR